MKMIKISKYKELEKRKIGKHFIMDLEDCENTDRKRVIDFLSGLTFLNGSMCKITKNQFEIRLG